MFESNHEQDNKGLYDLDCIFFVLASRGRNIHGKAMKARKSVYNIFPESLGHQEVGKLRTQTLCRNGRSGTIGLEFAAKNSKCWIRERSVMRSSNNSECAAAFAGPSRPDCKVSKSLVWPCISSQK